MSCVDRMQRMIMNSQHLLYMTMSDLKFNKTHFPVQLKFRGGENESEFDMNMCRQLQARTASPLCYSSFALVTV